MLKSIGKLAALVAAIAITAKLVERLTRPASRDVADAVDILQSQSNSGQSGERDNGMASKDPREPFTRISAVEAKEKVDNDNVQVIDVRTPGEYLGGHVPGAINIPHMSVVNRKADLAPDKELVFICEVGSRSALACEFAAALGFKDLYNVEGGTQAWIKAGYATE